MSSRYPDLGRTYRQFVDAVFSDSTLRETVLPMPDPAPVPELEVQARWFAGEFGRSFRSVDDQSVEVLQFGHWNRSAGPDFTECVVEIDGKKQAGAIEIDLDATSWEAHGHGGNPAFDEVVLHVFVRHPAADRFFTRDSRHREIVQVQLDPAKVAPPGTGWNRLPEARLGRCAAPLGEMPEKRLETLLRAAAQHRISEKAARLSAIAEAHSENQALFQGLAEALGFRHNNVVMAVLAQRLPLKLLRNAEPEIREALLFGSAGFIGHEQFESADPKSKSYLKSLWDHWWKCRNDYEPDAERELDWKLGGVRPLNHPQRRVGALAMLANHWPSFRSRLPKPGAQSGEPWPRRAQEHLLELRHDFWEHHYTLRSKPSEKRMALIGKDRVHDILGNVVFPFVLRDQPAQWARFEELPGSDSNESLRRAGLRLFGEGNPAADRFTRKFYHQQALLQIYRDFCLEDTSECEDCPFPEQLRQWK